jgi:hypothetical protein
MFGGVGDASTRQTVPALGAGRSAEIVGGQARGIAAPAGSVLAEAGE